MVMMSGLSSTTMIVFFVSILVLYPVAERLSET
jgi:hypothetical protein